MATSEFVPVVSSDLTRLSPRERLIVALDYPNAAEARPIAAALRQSAGWLKIGKQLFTAEGPALVRELAQAGHRIFLDLKYFDIPNTVAGAVGAAAALGVEMITVHAIGGVAMLRSAVEAAHKAEVPPMIVAVTVLTSHSQAELHETGVAGDVMEQVLRLAALAKTAGCAGVVASAQEATAIRRELGEGFAIVTPGVRPAGAAHDDQARVVTPAEAIRAGATHIVVGRPITSSSDSRAATRQILQEIELATTPHS